MSPVALSLHRRCQPQGRPCPRGRMRSSSAEKALDLADGRPIDLGDLGNRHAVSYPTADARELRPRNLARRLRLGADRCFDLLETVRRRRRDFQHPRFPRRWVGWWGARNQLLGDLPFRSEQRLGRLARSGDPLAIIAARVRLLAKQDLLRTVDPSATSKEGFVNFGKLDLGSQEGIRKLGLWPSAHVPNPNVSTKYRCHRLCQFEMSLRVGSGGGRARSPRRSAAPDRRPRHRSRNRTGCLTERASARSARRKVQPTLNRRASR